MNNAIGDLPHVLVEEILQSLPVKSLLRFTSVSKQWNSTIKSEYFASKHLIRAESRNPDILLCGAQCEDDNDSSTYSYLRTLMLGSWDSEKIHINLPHSCYAVTLSCDGLVCAFNMTTLFYVINPATRWHRILPPAQIQQINRLRRNLAQSNIKFNHPGFGRDISTGKYKMVLLYDSIDVDLRGPTTCEVFDFNTNTWRHVIGATHSIYDIIRPVYFDGSLYWITVDWFKEETKMLSFDLEKEAFHVMSETPIIHALPHYIILCSLKSRLCVSEIKSNSQDIWTLNSHKTWEKTFTINLGIVSSWFGKPILPITPVTIFDENQLILHKKTAKHPGLVVQDTILDSYSLSLRVHHLDRAVSYFPSLFSI